MKNIIKTNGELTKFIGGLATIHPQTLGECVDMTHLFKAFGNETKRLKGEIKEFILKKSDSLGEELPLKLENDGRIIRIAYSAPSVDIIKLGDVAEETRKVSLLNMELDDLLLQKESLTKKIKDVQHEIKLQEKRIENKSQCRVRPTEIKSVTAI